MDVNDFNQFIRLLYDSHPVYRTMVAKKPPFPPEKLGVPPAMWDGEVDSDGWVGWKILPSTISELDILEFFNGLGVTPPSALMEYMKSDFHMIDQVNNGKRLTSLPHIPSDNPFGPMRDLLLLPWKSLIDLGYIPIAEMEDGWGPICYKQSDKSIVWFDHEEITPLGEEKWPAKITSFENPLFDSIDEFYMDTFTVAPETNEIGDEVSSVGFADRLKAWVRSLMIWKTSMQKTL